MGLLDPSTSDGRVIFFLPWQNVTLAGKNPSIWYYSDIASHYKRKKVVRLIGDTDKFKVFVKLGIYP